MILRNIISLYFVIFLLRIQDFFFCAFICLAVDFVIIFVFLSNTIFVSHARSQSLARNLYQEALPLIQAGGGASDTVFLAGDKEQVRSQILYDIFLQKTHRVNRPVICCLSLVTYYLLLITRNFLN